MENRFIIKQFLSIAPEFFITSFAHGLYLLQSLVQNKIFTTCFETEVFGQWSLIVSAYTLISMIPFSSLDHGIYKVANSCRTQKKEKELYSLLAFVYFSGFLIYTVLLLVMLKVQGNRFFANGYLLPFILYSTTEILKNTYIILDNAYRNRTHVLYIRIFDISNRTVLFLLFNWFGIFTIDNILWIIIVTNILILCFQREYIKPITFKMDKRYCRELSIQILSFSGPLLTWGIFGWMQNMISRWYLDAILNLESVAIYSVLTALSYFVPNAVYSSINAFVIPIIYQKNKKFTRSGLLKYMMVILVPLLGYWLFITFFGKYLVLLLTDKKYLVICDYLPYTTMTAILYVIAMLSTVEIYRQGNTKKLIFSTILPGAFMATAGYFIIRQWEFAGAVANYMIGHMLYFVLTFLVVFNKHNIDYGVQNDKAHT